MAMPVEAPGFKGDKGPAGRLQCDNVSIRDHLRPFSTTKFQDYVHLQVKNWSDNEGAVQSEYTQSKANILTDSTES
jgi:hypothetical protein